MQKPIGYGACFYGPTLRNFEIENKIDFILDNHQMKLIDLLLHLIKILPIQFIKVKTKLSVILAYLHNKIIKKFKKQGGGFL